MDALNERLKNMTPLQRAAYALKETQARLNALERQRTEPIAIVGMACRFPGGAIDPDSYWRMLCNGVDAMEDVPADRWNIDDYYDPDPAAPSKMCTRRGGFLHDIHDFDNHFFAISDAEAIRIDPQYRILLELTWETLEDAGVPPAQLRGSRTGVFIGISTSEYGLMLTSDLAQTHPHVPAGTSLCMAANRVSYAYGLQGPSFVIDTACSSSLVALHQACQSIRSGECTGALVGGANLLLNPIGTVNLTKAGFCAPDGRVRAFDAAASGYVRSEGAGLVMLMPLSAAEDASLPIYGVIRGSAVTQNGASNGLSAPSRAAQEQVLREAYRAARVSPSMVQFVETQGTGTRLGDSIEAKALGEVLSKDRPAESRCALGAVKTNIGHLEAASGIASLMKVALALKHQELPPNINFEKATPDVDFSTLPLRIPTQLEPWPESEQPRIAGVSAFGYGGSNSHVVLEAAPVVATSAPGETSSDLRLLPLSARTEPALRELAQRFRDYLSDSPAAWSDVCHTAAQRRDHHDCRISLLADSCGDAVSALSNYLSGESTRVVATGRKPVGSGVNVGFLFSDYEEGLQETITHLVETADGFDAVCSEIDAACRRCLGRSLSAIAGDEPHHCDHNSARDATLLSQLLLTAWWRHVGVVPKIVLGRGVGELAAAVAAEILTVDEVLGLVSAECRGNGAPPAVIELKPKAATLPFVSSLDGKRHSGADLDLSHWQRCFRSTRANPEAFATLAERHIDLVLEMGQASTDESIVRFLSEQLAGDCAIPAIVTTEIGSLDVLSAVSRLYTVGVDLEWTQLSTAAGRCVSLPGYPWQRRNLQVSGLKQLGLPSSAAAVESAGSGFASGAVSTADSSERPQRPDITTQHVPPRNTLEAALTEAWADVLKMDGIGVYDNFFELGGDSLQVTVLLNRLQDDLGVAVPVHALFEVQTISDLSDLLRSQFAEALSLQFTDDGAAKNDGSNAQFADTAAVEPVSTVTDQAAAVATIPRLSRDDGPLDDVLERMDDLSDEELEALLGAAGDDAKGQE